MKLLDLLFPKKCVQCRRFGEYICADCFAGISFDVSLMCLVCNRPAMFGITHPICRRSRGIDGSFASVVYKGIIKKLIYQFKYKPYLTDLQTVLSELFYEGIIQHEQFNRLLAVESILVPIPLHNRKFSQRGYNHAEILSNNLGKRLGLETKGILKRKRSTSAQSNLLRDERLGNIKDAFVVSDQFSSVKYRQIILVDDIITSGATMLEAAKTLKKAGVEEVWGIALAHGK